MGGTTAGRDKCTPRMARRGSRRSNRAATAGRGSAGPSSPPRGAARARRTSFKKPPASGPPCPAVPGAAPSKWSARAGQASPIFCDRDGADGAAREPAAGQPPVAGLAVARDITEGRVLPCSLAASAPGGPAGRVFHVNIRAWVCVRERWMGIRGSARGVRGARGAVAGNLVPRREGRAGARPLATGTQRRRQTGWLNALRAIGTSPSTRWRTTVTDSAEAVVLDLE